MTVCSDCGGSGVLRLTSERFRTCLSCLGRGAAPAWPPRTRSDSSLLILPLASELGRLPRSGGRQWLSDAAASAAR
jgi:hypothetical protein